MNRLRTPIPLLPAAWLILVVLAAALADVLPLADPLDQQLLRSLEPPSGSHWLGTDSLGRDVFSRAVLGLRVSLLVGFGSVGIAMLVGGCLGLIAGFYRGGIDTWVSAAMTVILAFPPLILAMAIIAFAGASLTKVIVALGVLFMPACARLVRAGVLRFSQQEFVLAARSVGMRDWRILLGELVPNLYAPVLAYGLLMVAVAIVGEAGLSFLGLSVPPPQPSLGGMISAERSNLGLAPWAVFGPAVLLSLTVLCLNLAGDQLQRRLDRREASL